MTGAPLGRRRVPGLMAGASAASLMASTLSATALRQRPLYRDPAAPIDLRVHDPMARMTLGANSRDLQSATLTIA